MLSKATLPWRSASSSTRNVRLLTAILRQYYTVRSVDEQLRSTLQRSRHQCNIQRAYTVDHSSSASPASNAARVPLHSSVRGVLTVPDRLRATCTDALGCDVCSAE
jgi:hypothetical protein